MTAQAPEVRIPDVHAQQRPAGAEYFTKYPGRFIAIHLQDVDQQAPATTNQHDSPVTLVPVGKGSIDWTKAFTAARIGGVEHIFVDQRMEFMRESVAFLKALKA